MKTPNLKLTDDQVAFFHRQGYLALPALTTPEEVANLCAVYDRMFETKAGRSEGNHLDLTTTDEDDQKEEGLPQILSPSRYAPDLIDTLLRVNAAAIMQQLLGPDVDFRGDHAIRKPALTGAATPWHQDQAYALPDRDYNEVSIWVPLQEATLENGCMHFVPGSHLQDIYPHHPIGNDPRIIGLEVDDPERWAKLGVACPLPPGGATLHHCKTMHYTGPNTLDGLRRAYIMSFGLPPTQRAVPHQFHWLEQQKTKWQERAATAAAATIQSQ